MEIYYLLVVINYCNEREPRGSPNLEGDPNFFAQTTQDLGVAKMYRLYLDWDSEIKVQIKIQVQLITLRFQKLSLSPKQ